MATIREISEKAGVSIATVSKVLNGKKGVSQATIDSVLSIARELSYRPNLTARSLKNGQSRTLGVITEDLTVFNTPEIVDGIDAYCESQGY
ncbi:MAG: LacI family DNA-binding transcriptional regulator, partial [Bacillota bacterium]